MPQLWFNLFMTPAARIQAVIDLLEKINASRIPMDSVCGDYFRVRRYIGSQDRAEIAARIYDVVRHHARLAWRLEQAALEDIPRNRLLAFLTLSETDKRIGDLFNGAKHSPASLTSGEEEALERLMNISMENCPEAIRAECPPEHEQRLREVFGENFAVEMEAMLHAAPLDLRVNSFKCTREKAQKFLEADNVETDVTPYSPWGLRCRAKAFLSRTKAFSKGWIDIQDEGSQLIAVIAEPGPGMQVLDYCAGAGGKTLALAAAMQNKGRIVAMDLDERRLAKAAPRIKKAGVSDIIELRPLSEERHQKWLKRQKGTFDLVLVDVPCSGSGTWRRNPDMRWRTYGPSLEELQEIQSEILEKVAPRVKPGGRLVYATCSLFREENESRIEEFLLQHKDFSLALIETDYAAGGIMRLSPYRTETDGFFAAVMQCNII